MNSKSGSRWNVSIDNFQDAYSIITWSYIMYHKQALRICQLR